VNVHDLPTPALLVDREAFEHNVATMAAARPAAALRPHVKAFKSTALAAELAHAGHRGFCCATPRELLGMAAVGLGHDLLLANEVLDPQHLAALAGASRSGRARVTVAVDSEATVEAAATAGIAEVLIDVAVGMPRCGCLPGDAGRLADLARRRGLEVRGVMGYEGHVVGVVDRDRREDLAERAMADLVAAHEVVGGDVISGGGTGTYDCNPWVTELQAGSYVLMDTHYGRLDLPFRQGLFLWTTVISTNDRWAVADGGLKSLGMDHGDPDIPGAQVFFCSDEHITFTPLEESEGGAVPDVAGPGPVEPATEDGDVPHGAGGAVPGGTGGDERSVWGSDPRGVEGAMTWPPPVGSKLRVVPAHIDPTIALHEWLWVLDGDEVVDRWPVDLRGW
jgi:D-threonine aldolase